MNKKVTRKQFLLSIVSVATILAASKIPPLVKTAISTSKKQGNNYGNYSYGGSKKNV